MSSDYSTQLTHLLRYPTLPSLTSQSIQNAPHHAMLLLKQALALQMSPTPSTGISIIIENRNLLGIPLEVPVPQPSPIRNRAGLQSSALEGQSRDIAGGMNSHTRNGSSHLPLGLPEAITRGFLDKGESLGINKAFMSAVSDLKVSFFRLRLTLALK
jgi:TBC1 domain family protein 5